MWGAVRVEHFAEHQHVVIPSDWVWGHVHWAARQDTRCYQNPYRTRIQSDNEQIVMLVLIHWAARQEMRSLYNYAGVSHLNAIPEVASHITGSLFVCTIEVAHACSRLHGTKAVGLSNE